MNIASKLPPQHVDRTYFSSGRAAFAFLMEHEKPTKVYLPAFCCWSLVSTMLERFRDVEVEFYGMSTFLDGPPNSRFWPEVGAGELFVRIHYFGHQNKGWVIHGNGIVLDDLSHSYMSIFEKGEPIQQGTYEFGSYRKILKVGDGGFINTYFNPVYEPSKKLDTWLRYESKDWRDMKEAENMLDRDWQVADISSQSLAVILTTNKEFVRQRRVQNEAFLEEHLKDLDVGRWHIMYRPGECPLNHSRMFDTQEERDDLRSFLRTKDIYTAIQWPTHPYILQNASEEVLASALYLERHTLAFPVMQEYNLNDMEYMINSVEEWKRSGT